MQPGQRGARFCVGRKGRSAAEHLVEHDTEAVQVGAGVDGASGDLLGRQVLGGAHHQARLGHVSVRDGLGDAEVGHFHPAVVG